MLLLAPLQRNIQESQQKGYTERALVCQLHSVMVYTMLYVLACVWCYIGYAGSCHTDEDSAERTRDKGEEAHLQTHLPLYNTSEFMDVNNFTRVHYACAIVESLL